MRSRSRGYLILLAAAASALILARQRVSLEFASIETIILDLVGVALFVWFARFVGGALDPRRPAHGSRMGYSFSPRTVLEQHPGRVGLLMFSALSQLAGLNVKASGADSPDQWLRFTFWLLSISFFLLACSPSPSARFSLARAARWIGTRRLDLIVMLLLFSLGFLLRAIWRDTIPYPMSGDEASVGMSGIAITTGRVTNMFDTGWSSQPNLSFLIPGLIQWVFGSDIAGLRLFPAIAGSMAIPAIYLLALEMWGRRMAVVAAVGLATYAVHIHFSRIAVSNIVDATIAVTALYLLWRGRRTGSPHDFVAAGVVAGLGMYSYAGGRVLIVLIFMMLGFMALRDKGFIRGNALATVALFGGFLVTSLPMLLFFAAHTDIFMARASDVGIIQSGWLDRELQRPDRSLVGVMGEQLYRSLFAFVHVPAIGGFFNSPEPLLGVTGSVLFLIGLGWSIWRWRDPAFFLPLLWFFSIVGGTALFVGPPNTERMVSAIPAVILLVSLGLLLVVHLLQFILAAPDRLARVATAAAVLLLSLSSLRFYFLEYTPRYYFADINSEVGMVMGYYLRDLGPEYQAYFYGRPRMFAGNPSTDYLSAGVAVVDIPERLPEDMSFVARDGRVAFVFLPEWSHELGKVQARYPMGTLHRFPSKVKDELLFLVWEVPPTDIQRVEASR